ncbi:MAG: nuclear transport factor 2 family protein [Pseudomonadota bacterium]
MTDQTHLRALAERVVASNKDGSIGALLDDAYAPNCVSAESVAMEGGPGREATGIDAIRAKWDWWESAHEVHSSTATGPFLHSDNQFGVIFEIDVTDKNSGQRMQMQELGIYTVDNGKIVREEFFY